VRLVPHTSAAQQMELCPNSAHDGPSVSIRDNMLPLHSQNRDWTRHNAWYHSTEVPSKRSRSLPSTAMIIDIVNLPYAHRTSRVKTLDCPIPSRLASLPRPYQVICAHASQETRKKIDPRTRRTPPKSRCNRCYARLEAKGRSPLGLLRRSKTSIPCLIRWSPPRPFLRQK
jgi:hypothetical protein